MTFKGRINSINYNNEKKCIVIVVIHSTKAFNFKIKLIILKSSEPTISHTVTTMIWVNFHIILSFYKVENVNKNWKVCI